MKMKMKEEAHTQASQLKPISMSKKIATGSKAEKKRGLVHLRLAMLEQDQGTDGISNGTPDPTLQPLEISRPTKTKRSIQLSKEQSSYANSPAMKKAQEVQASLSNEYPSLVKYMKHSHVDSGFWLGLPKEFCVQHLPKSDTMMRLIDESGEASYAKYLAGKHGLSGRWKGFATAHKLVEHDVLVFHLVKKTTFKVYIIRQNGLDDINGALGLPNSDTCDHEMTSKQDDDDHNDDDCDGEKDNKIEDLDNILFDSPNIVDVGSEVLDWIKLSEPGETVNLESFDKFSILLDGSVSINAKFPDHIRRKYYNLCIEQNSPLHEKLLKGLNCTLVVGIINETINISNAIRSNTTKVSESDLLTYDKTLQGFELLGMNVGFIRLDIQKLMRRVIEDEEKVVLEAKFEREVVEEEMKKLEVKFLDLRKQVEEMDKEIEVMEERTKRKRFKLKEMEVSSFW